MLWGGEVSRKEARLLRLFFMQLMTFRFCLPFCQCSRARCRKLLQKISCNLGNISNALSVTWLCDWKEHFIWRCAIFWCYWRYTITFPVIYHIVEYRDKYASPYIYHITEKYRDRFSQLLYTKWCLLLAGDVQQFFSSKSSLEHIMQQEDFFPLNWSIAFRKEEPGPICLLQQERRVSWEWQCCRGTPFSLEIWEQWFRARAT